MRRCCRGRRRRLTGDNDQCSSSIDSWLKNLERCSLGFNGKRKGRNETTLQKVFTGTEQSAQVLSSDGDGVQGASEIVDNKKNW